MRSLLAGFLACAGLARGFARGRPGLPAAVPGPVFVPTEAVPVARGEAAVGRQILHWRKDSGAPEA